MSPKNMIDVWDIETFDAALQRLCRDHSDLIKNYFDRDRDIRENREASDHAHIAHVNQHAAAFVRLTESLIEQMNSRTIRAWHYTRLTDLEVEAIKTEGIQTSTPDTLASRIDNQIAAGVLDRQFADALHASSPFNSDQREARLGKFWMTSSPVVVSDFGVRPLLSHWGGEVAYFHQKDQAMLSVLRGIGRPRVLEIGVPLEATRHVTWAAKAVISSFGRNLGCDSSREMFDLYVVRPLSADSVLKIVSEGDTEFMELGRTYPARFRDWVSDCI